MRIAKLKIAFAGLCLLLAGMVLPARAQQGASSITGVVSDSDGAPLPGVVVYEKGNLSSGTMTGGDGSYRIRVAGREPVLVFSLMGYHDLEVAAGGRAVVNAVLEVDANYLEEVVVVGYGTQKKEFVVGSVSQVTARELVKAPAPNVSGMLAGRLPGLTAIQTTGTPGEDFANIFVRGMNTFNNNKSPLLIIDGLERPISQLSQINPNDIASISVLKDAATAAIYGVKGGNGVILVTTKAGTSSGNATISYDGSVTFNTNAFKPDLMTGEQYVYWHNLSRTQNGLDPFFTEENIQKMKDYGIYADNTDWLAEVYKPFGLVHQHTLSANGGNERVKYFTSIGYMNQDGILKNTSYRRYTVRSNIDAQLADGLRFILNLSGRYSERHKPGYGIGYQGEFNPITQALRNIPILAADASYNGLEVGWKNGTYPQTPHSSLMDSGYNDQNIWDASGLAKLEYSFDVIPALTGLKASVSVGLNYTNTNDRNYMHSFKHYSLDATTFTLVEGTSLGISKDSFNRSASLGTDVTIRPTIEYDRTFAKKHHVSALALFERIKYYGETMTGAKSGYISSEPMDLSMGLENAGNPVSGSYSHSGYASFAERVNYAYDEKYIAELTLREDASYVFAPKNRWGFFPSLALGWVVTKENFMKNVSWIDFLKIRGSVGQLGSSDVDPYLYIQSFNTTSPNHAYGIGGSPVMAFYTSGYVYDDLTWSHSTKYNVGFDATLLKQHLTLGFDWFYSYTDRILENVSAHSSFAPSLGENNPVWMNSGKMDNRGFELTVRHDNWFSNGLTYSISGMVAWSRNRVLERILADDHPSYRAVLGEPIGQLYGFHALGFFQTQEDLDGYPSAPSGYKDLGELMYEDQNGDGIISEAYDFIKIGRGLVPEMTFSLNTEVSWKGISLSALFQGATLCNFTLTDTYNNGNMDNTMYSRTFYGNGNGMLHMAEGSWRPDYTDAKYPRLRDSYNSNNAWASDWWIVDGSYLRLKNLQLSYALPARWVRAIRMQNIAVYLAGTNLFTISAFPYLDPENPGLNNGYYPQSRTYSFGVNLTF